MLLSEVRTRVRLKVQDAVVTGIPNKWADSDIDLALEEALRRVQAETTRLGLHYLFRKVHNITTVADKEFYQLPPDVRSIVAVRRTDLGDDYPRLIPSDESLRARYRYGSEFTIVDDNSQPIDRQSEVATRYYLRDGGIALMPIPEGAIELRVEYVRRLHLPTKDNDSIELPDEALNAWICWTAIVLKQSVDEPTGDLPQLYQMYLQDLRMGVADRQLNQERFTKAEWNAKTDMTGFRG